MGDEEHKATKAGIVTKVFFKLSQRWKFFKSPFLCILPYTLSSIANFDTTKNHRKEDTFEEDAQRDRRTCEDWQQLQKLGLWDVVCGSGIFSHFHLCYFSSLDQISNFSEE